MKKHFLATSVPMLIIGTANSATVGLTWYDNGVSISGPSSCTLGGTFTPPTPPARPGYRFTGWHVATIHNTCGIPDLDISIQESSRKFGFTGLNGISGQKESTYGLTVGSGQWAEKLSYGVVYGMGNCNSTDGGSMGTVNNNLNTGSSGMYCWCQVTGFTPYREDNNYTGGPECNVSPVSSSWVFLWENNPNCLTACPYHCVNMFGQHSDLRRALFGAVGQ